MTRPPLALRPPAPTLSREAVFAHFPGYLGAGPNSWRTTPVGVVHCGDWKLMEFYEDHHLELYNLREDTGEVKNLAETNKDKAAELLDRLTAWRSAVGAKMPAPHKAGEKPANFGKNRDSGDD